MSDQKAWLEARIPTFVKAQQEKETSTFFEETYDSWYKKWPIPAPTEDEIREVGEGCAKRALACKRKVVNGVSVFVIQNCMTFTLEFQQIKFWFHNHTRGALLGDGTRGVLKLATSRKVMQLWQAYLNKYQKTKLKDKIHDA